VLASFAWAAAMAGFAVHRHGWNRPVGRVWAGIAGVLVLLALTTWLDVALLVEQSMRQLSRNEGWYDLRRVPQVTLLIGIGAAAFFAFRVATRRSEVVDRAGRIALGVSLALVVIAVARASSWTYADSILGFGTARVTLGRVVEFIGAAAIGIGAIFFHRPPTAQS